MSAPTDVGTLVLRATMPTKTGVDALEARLVVVQEVPPKVELRFFAVRGDEREPLSSQAARDVLRDHIPPRVPSEMSAVELWIEVSTLRADVDRMRPVYEAAKAWRGRRADLDPLDHLLVEAVDAAVAAERT